MFESKYEHSSVRGGSKRSSIQDDRTTALGLSSDSQSNSVSLVSLPTDQVRPQMLIHMHIIAPLKDVGHRKDTMEWKGSLRRTIR